MSNEYKDWLWDHIQDLAIERGIIDQIIEVIPDDPAKGRPNFLYGLKNGQLIKLAVLYDEALGYVYEHRELDKN